MCTTARMRSCPIISMWHGSTKPVLNSIAFKSEEIDIRKLYNVLFLILCRLHREALKQSATDPLSGKIDVGILTTGLSSAARKRRQELTQALRTLLASKAKGSSLSYQRVLADIKESSQLVCFYMFYFFN